MNTLAQNINIQSITYDSISDYASLVGTVSKGHLSYDISFITSFSELNTILNQLQSNNNMDVYDSIIEEKIAADYTQFYLDGKRLENTNISYMIAETTAEYKQIRA